MTTPLPASPSSPFHSVPLAYKSSSQALLLETGTRIRVVIRKSPSIIFCPSFCSVCIINKDFFFKYCVLNCSGCASLFATLWIMTGLAPLSMGFFRQEHRSGLTDLLQKILQTQGSELNLLCLLHWQAGSLPLVKPFLKY